MVPNPNLVASALAYVTEAEGIDVGIFPMGRSLGKSREPLRAAEEYAMIDVMSGGRLVPGLVVGLSYDFRRETTASRRSRCASASTRTSSWCCAPGTSRRRSRGTASSPSTPWSTCGPGRCRPTCRPGSPASATPTPCGCAWSAASGSPISAGSAPSSRASASSTASGRSPTRSACPRNPYRLGFLQTVAVAESDEQAERDYAEHLEYGFRKGLGSIPMEKLGLPGGIDIRGVQALLKDPVTSGYYYQMKTATYRNLVNAGVVIAGSPATVRDQLKEFCRRVRHRQPARHARLRLAAAAPGDEEHPALL